MNARHSRYPYVYEFRQALELDPGNGLLHRELAYLLLTVSESGHRRPEQRLKKSSPPSSLPSSDPAQPEDYVPMAQLGFLYLEDHRMDLAMPLLNMVLAHGAEATANRVRVAIANATARAAVA